MYCIPVTSSWIVPAKLRHVTAVRAPGRLAIHEGVGRNFACAAADVLPRRR